MTLLQLPDAPNQKLRTDRHNVSLQFVDEEWALVADGAGKLLLIHTGDRKQDKTWKVRWRAVVCRMRMACACRPPAPAHSCAFHKSKETVRKRACVREMFVVSPIISPCHVLLHMHVVKDHRVKNLCCPFISRSLGVFRPRGQSRAALWSRRCRTPEAIMRTTAVRFKQDGCQFHMFKPPHHGVESCSKSLLN